MFCSSFRLQSELRAYNKLCLFAHIFWFSIHALNSGQLHNTCCWLCLFTAVVIWRETNWLLNPLGFFLFSNSKNVFNVVFVFFSILFLFFAWLDFGLECFKSLSIVLHVGELNAFFPSKSTFSSWHEATKITRCNYRQCFSTIFHCSIEFNSFRLFFA